MQNISESTTFSTFFYDDYFANSTLEKTETPDVAIEPRSVNIMGILWPIVFTVLIVLSNLLILVAFGIEKRLRSYNNYFIINLTVLDLITGLLLVPNVIHTHIGYYPFSHDICKVLSAAQTSILNASNLAVVVICADRHRATYDPINHFMSRGKRQAVIKNTIPWIVSFTFWFLFLTTPEFITDFDNGRHCIRWYTQKPFPGMVPFIVLFYLPFVVIAVLYFRIVLKIRATLGGKNVGKQFIEKGSDKERISAVSGQGEMTSSVSVVTINTELSSDSGDRELKLKKVNAGENAKKLRVKKESSKEMRKATRTLLFIVMAFIVSWLPRSIIMLIYSINAPLVVPGLPRPGRLFFGWMINANSLLNPISYAVSQPLFRSTIINLFLCRRN